jgi:hypothetical protein
MVSDIPVHHDADRRAGASPIARLTHQGLEHVQRFFVLLNPEGRPRYRLAAIGRKRLPEPRDPAQRRFWGFVAMVRDGTLDTSRAGREDAAAGTRRWIRPTSSTTKAPSSS